MRAGNSDDSIDATTACRACSKVTVIVADLAAADVLCVSCKDDQAMKGNLPA